MNKPKIGNYFENSTGIVRTVTNPLLKSIKAEDNKVLTENGAPTFKSTYNYVLDLFAMGAALRSRSEEGVIQMFTKAFAEDKLLTLKCLFNIRNIRGGAGERQTFRTILKFLGDNYPDIVEKNLGNIVYFGRFDDLFALFNTKSEATALNFIAYVINEDVDNFNKDKAITLAAKWMPSENTSSKATCSNASKIRKFLGWSSKQYRKTLSTLRSYGKVVEVAMSAKDWDSINYSHVPSKASLKYKDAFKKHDESRYNKFIADVKSGKAKINAAALFPHDIVRQARSYSAGEAVDVLWDALPNYLEGNERGILVVSDVSGSMSNAMGGIPLDMSLALAIYVAERNTGLFHNYFITYSAEPKLQQVIGNNIREKVANLQKHVAYNTNLQAVFDMLLTHAVDNNIQEKDMPEQVVILSDVEFDAPQNHGGDWRGNWNDAKPTNLDVIRAKYKVAGYEMPQLIYWNVNSKSNNVPAHANEKGVLMVSGASPSVFKTLLSGKEHTAYTQMIETLNNSQYDRVII